MTANPFLAILEPHHRLREETYQYIHALALQAAAKGLLPQAVPAHIPVEHLRLREERYGPDCYLSHPADLAVIFAGVTQTVYQTIADLYCSRVGRSIKMVWQILAAQAREAQTWPVSYEAVWAMCLFLEERRRSCVDVSIERGSESWWLGQVALPLRLQPFGGREENPSLFCLIDLNANRVLSFQVASQVAPLEERSDFVFYDAITSQRRPERRALAGVLWHLPHKIVTTVAFSSEGKKACSRLGIGMESTTDSPTLFRHIQDSWAKKLTGRLLQADQCVLLLDNYLDKIHGYGPVGERTQQEDRYRHLLGYQTDPTWLFPLLRSFLSKYATTITQEGIMVYNGVQYHDALLCYWPHQRAELQLLPTTKAAAWVYLDGEVLCQAQILEHSRFQRSGR